MLLQWMVREFFNLTQALYHPFMHFPKYSAWKVGDSFCNKSFCVFLKINIRGNFVPSTQTFTARVVCIVSCVKIQMLTVFTPLISEVCLEREVKKTGFDSYWWSIYCHNLSRLLFLNLLHEIQYIWCHLCRKMLRFMSTCPMPQFLFIQPLVHNHLFCTIWFGKECNTNLMSFREELL